jgi:uncharacterized membrane protein YeiH
MPKYGSNAKVLPIETWGKPLRAPTTPGSTPSSAPIVARFYDIVRGRRPVALPAKRGTCVLTIVYLIAITAEAMSGALAAGRRSMDIFGVVVIAFVTALGGGTIRDVILGRFPIGWTQHPEYVYVVVSAGLLTTVVARYLHRLQRAFLVLDAMGLVAFSLIGCTVALEMGYATVVVVMSGMITGIFGGILRDVLCAQVPVVFRRELYASVSLAVCALFLGLRMLDVDTDVNTATCFAGGLTLRLLAIRWGWRLPVFAYRDRWE